jgi:hypothetical protein
MVGEMKLRKPVPMKPKKVEIPKTVYNRKGLGWDEPGWEEEYNKNWMYPESCKVEKVGR